MLGLFYFHTDRPALFLFLAVDSGSVRGQRGSVRGQGGCVATKSVNDWSGIGPPYCFSNLHISLAVAMLLMLTVEIWHVWAVEVWHVWAVEVLSFSGPSADSVASVSEMEVVALWVS